MRYHFISITGLIYRAKTTRCCKCNEIWNTRFELVTSCLSSKRSKPTELADHYFFEILTKKTLVLLVLFCNLILSKSGAKVRRFLKLTKKF